MSKRAFLVSGADDFAPDLVDALLRSGYDILYFSNDGFFIDVFSDASINYFHNSSLIVTALAIAYQPSLFINLNRGLDLDSMSIQIQLHRIFKFDAYQLDLSEE